MNFFDKHYKFQNKRYNGDDLRVGGLVPTLKSRVLLSFSSVTFLYLLEIYAYLPISKHYLIVEL